MNKTVYIGEKYVFYKLIIEGYISKSSLNLTGYSSEPKGIITGIKETQPDLAFINYEIYGDDIFYIINKIKEISPKTEIIVHMAQKNKLLIKSLKEEGVIGILNKPFSEIELINLLNSRIK